ncbi:protein AGENET DOMAIN (AGD)-CONTAINING P1-like [Silene latifolia]|uniref:protein AGENET DOMAIN (AGD)-CONTAINING P1-like n=1 Tax=Silene latifolia TaxID=37657 RepID=UPI003D77047D
MAHFFNIGDMVEVMFPQVGFVGSFFVATILLVLQDGRLYVQFHHLLSANGIFFLRSVVAATNIRPIPPFIGTSEYELDDIVDVFVNDGWWVGRVVDVLRSDGYYEIRFEMYDEVSFNEFFDMRPHLEWEDGRWVSVLE